MAGAASRNLLLPGRLPREPQVRAPWPDWVAWKPNTIWCYDFTHFTRARWVAVAVLDIVSRKWLACVVSAEETSTQIEVRFTDDGAGHPAGGGGEVRRRPVHGGDGVSDREAGRLGRARSGRAGPFGHDRRAGGVGRNHIPESERRAPATVPPPINTGWLKGSAQLSQTGYQSGCWSPDCQSGRQSGCWSPDCQSGRQSGYWSPDCQSGWGEGYSAPTSMR
jgi:hypothetical protein